MAYDLMALLADESPITFERLAAMVRELFATDPSASVGVVPRPGAATDEDEHIAVRWGDWSLRISYEDEPHVLEESRELADIHPDRDAVAECRRRITVAGDDDPDMDHLHGYCFMVELLEDQPGVFLFDPVSNEFIGAEPD